MSRWLCFLFLAAGACLPRPLVKGPGDPEAGVTITWWGHACFSFRDSADRVFLIDPFDETVGPPLPRGRFDAVLVTHEHFDHDAPPRPAPDVVLRSTGVNTVAGIEVTGVLADHDDQGGRRNGFTRIYVWTQGGLRLAHLGDIGQRTLRPEQREALRGVDVLFIPVGGKTTVDAAAARGLVAAIRPRVVVPMHYGNPGVRFFPFDPVDPFLALFPGAVQRTGSTFTLRRGDLPAETRIDVPALPS